MQLSKYVSRNLHQASFDNENEAIDYAVKLFNKHKSCNVILSRGVFYVSSPRCDLVRSFEREVWSNGRVIRNEF